MQIGIKRLIVAGLLAGSAVMALSQAGYAYQPEPDLMEAKGYSPDLIKATQDQRTRQEWDQPAAPAMTKKERFFHNIYYNNWTGSIDEFGASVLRDN